MKKQHKYLASAALCVAVFLTVLLLFEKENKITPLGVIVCLSMCVCAIVFCISLAGYLAHGK